MARTAIKDIQIYAPDLAANDAFKHYTYVDEEGATQHAFPVTDQCERSAALMGDDYVRLRFNLTAYVPLKAFSFIRYDGQTFFLMNDYNPQSKGSERNTENNEIVSDAYEYDVKFYSVANMLRKPVCYRHVVVGDNEWDEPEISVSATLETMYVIIVGSIAQYTSRLNSSFLFKRMLDTLVTNGLGDPMSWQPAQGVKLTANTELATFNFNGDNIADVCTSVANTYTDEKKETEWYIEEVDDSTAIHSLTLHFCKCEEEVDNPVLLTDFSEKNNGVDKYKRPVTTGGLSKVDYSRDTSNIPQMIVPFGAERNMTYQAVKGIDEISQMQSTFGKRLRLLPNTTYTVRDKNNVEHTITTDSHGGLANDTVNTGVERVEFFEDVYPQCHFKITEVVERIKRQDGSNVPEYTCKGEVVSDSGVPFVESDFFPIKIEEGTTLSVRFESGYLNGREFEIANKSSKKNDEGGMDDHYTLKFVIVSDGSLEDGTLIPSGSFIPRVGDKFALFNMKMPSVYITYAQAELAQKAYERLLEYQETLPDMKCTTSPRDFGGKAVYLGKKYKINSEKIGFTLNGNNQRVPIDFISRITKYSFKLTKGDEVEFTLSSSIVRGTLAELANAITSVTNTTGGLGQRSVNLSRRGWRDASEVADMLQSVTAEMMLIGNAKYQFVFTSEIKPVHNNSGVFQHLAVGYGTLQHTQDPYVNYANGGLWEISGGQEIDTDYDDNPLDGEQAYYVFADVQAQAAGSTADILLVPNDENADAYRSSADYMLLGILSSEFEEVRNGVTTHERVFSRTNGFTAIEGGTITTEQIQDANRQLIIDFQSNPPRIIAVNGAEIYGNIRFKSLVNEDNEDVLANMKNYVDTITEDLQRQIDGQAVSFFMEGNPTLNNMPAVEWDTNAKKDEHVGDSYTNILKSEVNLAEVKDGVPYWVEQGYLTTTQGLIYEEQKQSVPFFCRTKGIFELKTGISIGATENGIKHTVYLYDADKRYVTSGSELNTAESLDNYVGTYSYFAVLYSNGGVNFTPADLVGKISSSGDIFYPTAGHSWRFIKDETGSTPSWYWVEITDSDALRALQLAAQAQDTADGKRRVFVSQPVPPYDAGDLWANAVYPAGTGSTYNNVLLKCKIAKTSTQAFSISDWEDSSRAVQSADNAMIEALKEIGGENLYGGADPLTCKVGYTDTDVVLKNGVKYIIYLESIDGNAYSLSAYSKKNGTYSSLQTIINGGSIGTLQHYSEKYVVVQGNGGTLSFSVNASGSTYYYTLTRIMVQKGEKHTAYQAGYLAKALERIAAQEVTSIDGGLILSALIKLAQGGVVRSGMSGLADYGQQTIGGEDYYSEGVGFWAGGDYSDAIAAACGLLSNIPVLLTKTGILSRIGCFRVVDKDTISVTTDENTIYVTNKSISDVATVESTHREECLGKYEYLDSAGSKSGDVFATKSFSISGGTYTIKVPAYKIDASANSSTRLINGAYAQVEGSFTLCLKIRHSNGTTIYESDSKHGSVSANCYGPGESNSDTDTKTIPAIELNDVELPVGTVTIEIYGFYSMSVSGQNMLNSNISFQGHAVTAAIINTGKYVVLAKDGIGIIANSDATFYVKTDSADKLKVIAKGLPTSEPSETGQLWQKTISYKNAAGQNESAKVICIK